MLQVPETVDSACTSRVLVMEWLTGTRPSEAASRAELLALVDCGVQASLVQLLEVACNTQQNRLNLHRSCSVDCHCRINGA